MPGKHLEKYCNRRRTQWGINIGGMPLNNKALKNKSTRVMMSTKKRLPWENRTF